LQRAELDQLGSPLAQPLQVGVVIKIEGGIPRHTDARHGRGDNRPTVHRRFKNWGRPCGRHDRRDIDGALGRDAQFHTDALEGSILPHRDESQMALREDQAVVPRQIAPDRAPRLLLDRRFHELVMSWPAEAIEHHASHLDMWVETSIALDKRRRRTRHTAHINHQQDGTFQDACDLSRATFRSGGPAIEHPHDTLDDRHPIRWRQPRQGAPDTLLPHEPCV
jgi:hypothetical protein